MRILLRLLLLLFCGALPAQILSAEWRKQPSGTLAWLHSIYFLNAQKGWIVGSNGALLTTNDGGTSWKITQKPTNDTLRDVYFLDEKIGWLICEREFSKLRRHEPRSFLLETRDGGATWSRRDLDSQIARFVYSNNRQIAWGIGELGNLYQLQTADLQWRKQIAPTRFRLRDGMIFNHREALLLGAGATVLHTSDNGQSWRDAAVANSHNAFFNAASFAARDAGWAVANGGKIFVTVDGGKTWRAQNSLTDLDLLDVHFLNAQEGWVVGDAGILLHTTNGGGSWQQLPTKTTHRLERIFFDDQKRGFAVGFGGTILFYSASNVVKPQLSR